MSLEYETLDSSWIKEFEDTDKLYQEFYKDNVYYIHLSFLYVNGENTLEKVKEESYLLQNPNVLTREEMLGLLKRNTFLQEKKYSLLSILKYNITLSPEEIHSFLKSGQKERQEKDYFSLVKHIDDIFFEKTIHMFQDLNHLLIVYYERKEEDRAKNATKKVYFCQGKNHKKTVRK
jgi:hypothetical protein